MHGAIPPSIVARALLIMAWKCLIFLAPFLAVAAIWWIVNRTDRVVHYLFPHLEWERSLGWLNIKAERRAKKALRWFGYGIYALLAFTLLGIVWGATGLEAIIDQWPDLSVIASAVVPLTALVFSLGIWVAFLGTWLIPKLHTERETADLERFRRGVEEEEERSRDRYSPHSPSRVHSPLRKPRTNSPMAGLDRTRKRL